MSARYTPAPWWGDGRGAVMAGEPGNVRSICEVYGADGKPETLQANERLIAAAPTLADALRWLVDVLISDDETSSAAALDAYKAAMFNALTLLALVDDVPIDPDALRAHVAQFGGRHA